MRMSTVAVVPIFVNAGASVLPMVIGPVLSGVALLFKPRELIRVFRRRPIVPVIILVVGAGLWFGGEWLIGVMESGATAQANADPPAVDWREVGQRIVSQRRRQVTAANWMIDLPQTATAGRWPTSPPFLAVTSSPADDIVEGYDYSRCGYDGGPVPQGLREEWSAYRTVATFFFATPAVSNGKVFAASAILDITGKIGFIAAVNAGNGQEIWKQTSPTPEADPFYAFFSSPAVTKDGKYLVIGQGLHDSKDCAVICLDTKSGALKWQVGTPLHLESSPAIRGDLAVIGAGAIEDANHKAVGDPGFVLAVQISTGKTLWKHPVNDPESTPAIDENGIVYIGAGFNGNALVALRSESDEELKAKGLKREVWRVPAPYPVTSAVTLSGDLVIVGAGNCDYVNVDPRPAGMVMAVDRKTGSIRWQQEMGDSVLGFVSAREGKVVCPVRNGDVALLDQASGKQIWRKNIAGGTPILAGCAFTGTRIYVTTKTGKLLVLDAKNGDVLESVNVNDPNKPGSNGFMFSAPQIVGGNVYVGSETGGMRCFSGK